MRRLARNTALCGPSIALLTAIATTSLSRAYPGDVFVAGSPTKGPAVQKPVEIAAGAWNVSPQTGAATYTFSLPLPPGRGGMTPSSLALTYNSQSPLRGGIAAGWTLAGVPSIEVDTSSGILGGTFYQSGLAGGQRLIRVTEPGAEPGVETYRAESDSDYVRYEHHVDPGSGSTYWRALHPNGTIFEFGTYPNAREPHSAATAVRWMLTRATDPYGNYIAYEIRSWCADPQACVQRDLYLARIRYGGNTAAGLPHHVSIEMVYDDSLSTPCAGSQIPIGAAFTYRNGVPSYRGAATLSEIWIQSRSSESDPFVTRRAIYLDYDAAARSCSQPRAPLRLLTAIRQNVWTAAEASTPGSPGTPLPPITFTYGTAGRQLSPSAQAVPNASWSAASDLGQGRRHLDPTEDPGGWPGGQTMFADLNGDGFSDLLHAATPNESSCNVAVRFNGDPLSGGEYASAVDVAWPRRSWLGGASAPVLAYPREGCNLVYQMDRRSTAPEPSVDICPSISSNYTTYHLVDVEGDGIAELLTALDYKPGAYSPGNDGTAYRACTPEEADAPCILNNGARVECKAFFAPLVPTADNDPDGDADPTNDCGSCSSDDLDPCTNPDCSSTAIDGATCSQFPCPCTPENCPAHQPEVQALIGDVFQRSEVSADENIFWSGPAWNSGLVGTNETTSPTAYTNPACRYRPEARCHRYVWRIHHYDPVTRTWGAPEVIYAPTPLDSARASGRIGGDSVVAPFHAVLDIDGDHCPDALFQHPEYTEPATWTSGDLQVFRGDCHGHFSAKPDGTPYIWNMPTFASSVPDRPYRPRITLTRTRQINPDSPNLRRFSEDVTSLTDINGDGLVDWVIQRSAAGMGGTLLEVFFNNGTGFESTGTVLSADTSLFLNREESVVIRRHPANDQVTSGWSIAALRQHDFDSDGLPDVAELPSPTYEGDVSTADPWSPTNRTVALHVNVGDRLVRVEHSSDTDQWWTGLARITVTNKTRWWVKTDVRDFNGDGLPDQYGSGPSSSCDAPGPDSEIGWGSCVTQTAVERDANDALGQGVRLLRSIDNGRGATVEFEYGSSADRVGQDPLVVTSTGRLPQPMWLVRRMTVTAAPGATAAMTDYRYVRPIFNQNHQGQWAFRGFGAVNTWEPANDSEARRRVYRRYAYALDYSGRPLRTTVWDGDRLQTLEETVWQRGELFGGTVESFHPIATRHFTCTSTGGAGAGMESSSNADSETGPISADLPDDFTEDPYAPQGTGGSGGVTVAGADGVQIQSLLGGALSEDDCVAYGVLRRTTRRFVSISPESLSYSGISASLDLPSTGGVHLLPEGSTPIMYVQRGERLTDNAGPDPTLEAMPGDRGWVFGETLLYTPDQYELLSTDVRKVQATANLWAGYNLSGRTQTVYDSAGRGLPEISRVWRNETEYAETTRTFDTDTGNVLTVHKPSGLVTTTTYDNLRLFPASVTPVISGVSPPDLTVTYTHDIHTGLVTRQEGPAQPGKTTLPVVETDYDGEGRPTRVRRSFDSGNQYVTDTVKTVTYHDHQGDLLPHSVDVDELINRTAQKWIRRTITHDGLGRPMDESVQTGTGVATTSYVYDPASNLVSVAVPSPTESGTAVYTYEHDALGRVTAAHQPDTPAYWQFAYDGKRVTRELHVEDESGLLLDDTGMLRIAQRTIVDSDAFDRLRTVTERTATEPGVPGPDATWSYDYDPNDNMKQIVDADQIATSMTHDFAGHRRTVTRTDTRGINRTWQYDYDLAGNLVAEIMPFDDPFTIGDFTSTWAYDELGRVTSHRTASRGMTDTSRYFPASTGPGELFTYHTYDQAGHGSGVGRLTHVDLPFGSIDYQYTVEGWAKQEDRQFTLTPEGPNGRSLGDSRSYQVSYNALGQPLRVVHADHPTTPTVNRSVYDDRGLPLYVERLVKDANGIEQPTRLARVARNTAGVPTTRYSDFDQGQSWTYDSLGRVTSHAIRSCTAAPVALSVSRACAESGTTVGGETIAYYDSGDVDGIQDPFTGATIHYTFDAQHQLQHAETVGGSLYQADFAYTPAGRLDAATVTSSAPGVIGRDVRYEYSPADPVNDPPADPHAVRRVVDQSQNNLGVLDYDATGNLIHKSWSPPGPQSETQNHDFIYDGDNQLREVVNHKQGGDVSEIYFYDHTGQRMLAYTSADGSTPARLRLWFGQTEIEYDVATTPIQPVKTDVFASLGAMPVARIHRSAGTQPADAEVDLLYGGVLGSLLTVVGTPATPDPANHALLARYSYGPFGELLSEAGSESGNFHRLFNGKEHDELTSLSYYGYRFYDRLTLTWTEADPLYRFVPDLAWDEPRNANLYSFSLNNPLRYIDPDGRSPQTDADNVAEHTLCSSKSSKCRDGEPGSQTKKKSGQAGQEGLGSEGEEGDEAGGGAEDGVTGKRKLGRHNGGKKGGIERGTVGGAEEVDLPGGGERGLFRIPVTPETEQAVSGLMIVMTVVQAGVGAAKGALAAIRSVRGASTALGKSIKSLKETLKSGKGPWKLLSAHAEPAQSITKKLRGGTSVEQVFVQQETGERIYRHFITNNGEIYHEKFRDYTHFGE